MSCGGGSGREMMPREVMLLDGLEGPVSLP